MELEVSVTRTGLERVIVAEGPQRAGMLPGEYAGRIWLRLNGIDPDTVHQSSGDETDARALESAREVIERRFPRSPRFADQLGYWRDKIISQ